MLEFTITIFVVEIIALCFFIYAKYLSKKIRYTRTIFTSTVFLINFAIYMTAFVYNKSVTGNGNYGIGVVTSIASAMSTFLFRASPNDVATIVNDIPFFLYVFFLGYGLSAFTTISLVIDAFRYRIRNSIRFMRISQNNEIDYVVGDGFEARTYVRNYKNTILLLPNDTPKEKVNSLIREGFCVYPRLTNNFEVIVKMRKKKNKKYVFVVFDDDDTNAYLRAIQAFKSGENVDNVYLYLEVKYEKAEYLKSVLLNDEMTKTHITLFNRYENMTNDLCKDEPLSTYLPRDFINEDTSIKADKKINVFILGFGWMNQEIYKKLLINNQYIEQYKDTYRAHLVNYHIFDLSEARRGFYPAEGIEDVYQTLERNKAEYFDVPEKIGNVEFYTKNVESAAVLGQIEEICSDKNSMNYFFVSFGDSYHNLSLTSLIYERIRTTNFHIFARTTEMAICDPNIKNVTYFGDVSKYVVHDKIVNYELYNIGVRVNDAYVGHQTTLNDLLRRDFIKIYSNYYQAMNIRHKYHLLGFDFVKKNELKPDDISVSLEEFNNRIGLGTIKEYRDYFKQSNLAAQVYAEHLHWNCEYLVYGYKPLKVKDHVVVNGKIIEQDVPNKLHGAITSYYGLDLRTKFLLDKLKEIGNTDKVLFSIDGENAVEVYRYDYQFLSKSYNYLLDEGYVIIKKR